MKRARETSEPGNVIGATDATDSANDIDLESITKHRKTSHTTPLFAAGVCDEYGLDTKDLVEAMQERVSTSTQTTLSKLQQGQCPTFAECRDLIFMNVISDAELRELIWRIQPYHITIGENLQTLQQLERIWGFDYPWEQVSSATLQTLDWKQPENHNRLMRAYGSMFLPLEYFGYDSRQFPRQTPLLQRIQTCRQPGDACTTFVLGGSYVLYHIRRLMGLPNTFEPADVDVFMDSDLSREYKRLLQPTQQIGTSVYNVQIPWEGPTTHGDITYQFIEPIFRGYKPSAHTVQKIIIEQDLCCIHAFYDLRTGKVYTTMPAMISHLTGVISHRIDNIRPARLDKYRRRGYRIPRGTSISSSDTILSSHTTPSDTPVPGSGTTPSDTLQEEQEEIENDYRFTLHGMVRLDGKQPRPILRHPSDAWPAERLWMDGLNRYHVGECPLTFCLPEAVILRSPSWDIIHVKVTREEFDRWDSHVAAVASYNQEFSTVMIRCKREKDYMHFPRSIPPSTHSVTQLTFVIRSGELHLVSYEEKMPVLHTTEQTLT